MVDRYESKMDYLSNCLTYITLMVQSLLFKPTVSRFNIFKCPVKGVTKVLIYHADGHVLSEKNLAELINDKHFIATCDEQTARDLTHLAANETQKPNYSLLTQTMGEQSEDCLLHIKSHLDQQILVKRLSEINNQTFLSHLSPLDANRIGYLAGVRETVMEYQTRLQL